KTSAVRVISSKDAQHEHSTAHCEMRQLSAVTIRGSTRCVARVRTGKDTAMRKILCAIALAIPVAVFTQAPADSVSPRAKQLHDRAIVVDSHGDTTQRLIFDKAFDIGK